MSYCGSCCCFLLWQEWGDSCLSSVTDHTHKRRALHAQLLLKLPFCHLGKSVLKPPPLFFVPACLCFTVLTDSWEGAFAFVIFQYQRFNSFLFELHMCCKIFLRTCFIQSIHKKSCVILCFVRRAQRAPCKMVSVVTSIVQMDVKAGKGYSGFEWVCYLSPTESIHFSTVELGHWMA